MLGASIIKKNTLNIAKKNNQNELIQEQKIETAARKISEDMVSSRTETTTREERTEDANQSEEINVQNAEQTSKVETEKQELKQEIVTENENADSQEESKYISISEVKISQNMNLTIRTGLSKEDFIKLIAGVKADTSGFFEENAGIIYDLCEEYSINEIFFCGLISAESGWNIANNHRNTHNYISLMKNGKLINYSTVEEGLRVAAQKLHSNYLTPGGKFYYGKTLSSVKTKFCPESSTWVSLVYGRMKQII